MEGQEDGQITLRAAMLADCKRIWEWRNETATRKGSFRSDRISYAVHKKWFEGKLKDPCTSLLIVVDDHGRDVGYVRFDIGGANAEISVAIDSRERRKGYGLLAIRSGVQHILRQSPIGRVVARIRLENLRSVSTFRRAGFVPAGRVKVQGIDGHEMVYERTARTQTPDQEVLGFRPIR